MMNERQSAPDSSFIISFCRVGVYQDAGAGDFGLDGAEDSDGEVVRLRERLRGVYFEVEVDELGGAGATRPQVVEAVDAFAAEAADDRGDLRVYLARETPVHQDVDRVARDVEGRPEDEGRDGDGDERVG